jgi:hypothetical protein
LRDIFMRYTSQIFSMPDFNSAENFREIATDCNASFQSAAR